MCVNLLQLGMSSQNLCGLDFLLKFSGGRGRVKLPQIFQTKVVRCFNRIFDYFLQILDTIFCERVECLRLVDEKLSLIYVGENHFLLAKFCGYHERYYKLGYFVLFHVETMYG